MPEGVEPPRGVKPPRSFEPSDQYFYSDIESARPLFAPAATTDASTQITTGRLLWHLALFLITAITTTIAGTIFPYLLQDIDLFTLIRTVTAGPGPLINGIAFSFTLLVILGTHEMGHYIACRYYGISATLPYFIPVPPPLGVGTLGAFIRIKSPIQTRRALFDVGIAGPLAGFVFALPAAIVGVLYSQPLHTDAANMAVKFNQPLLFTLLAKLVNAPAETAWNPIWFACWVGMLATALNLMPVGQLDGGHVVYALFGKRGHRAVAFLITVVQAAVAYFAYTRYHWSGGFIYAGMLVLMFCLRHPQLVDEREPLGLWRKVLGVIALLVFILSFMPVPLEIN